jgi:hypothetical protein
MDRILPRPGGQQSFVRLKRDTYLRIARMVERMEKLRVNKPLMLQDLGGAPVISFQGTNDFFLFAKLTSQDGTKLWWYNWSEAQLTATAWAVKTGGRTGTTTGTTKDPAMWTDPTATFDLSTAAEPYVLLVRAQPDASGQSGWVIASPIGLCEDETRWGEMSWDAVNNQFKQASTTITYSQGLALKVAANSETIITGTDPCV